MIRNDFKPPMTGPQGCCDVDWRYETLMLNREWSVWEECWFCGKVWKWDGHARVWQQQGTRKAKAYG